MPCKPPLIWYNTDVRGHYVTKSIKNMDEEMFKDEFLLDEPAEGEEAETPDTEDDDVEEADPAADDEAV